VKSILELVARGLVDRESEVVVTELRSDRVAFFEVSVAEADYGQLIGRNGEHVKAVRCLMNSMGRKQGINVIVEINDPKHRRVK